MKIHVVQKGDTMWKIAQNYGVDIDAIIRMNSHVQNPDILIPGMKIKIPKSPLKDTGFHPVSEKMTHEPPSPHIPQHPTHPMTHEGMHPYYMKPHQHGMDADHDRDKYYPQQAPLITQPIMIPILYPIPMPYGYEPTYPPRPHAPCSTGGYREGEYSPHQEEPMDPFASEQL